jgi:photosystem II stability/assembly factor-like uncharacterized protein
MKNKLLSITTGITCILVANTVTAQWKTTGPYGGPMYAVESAGADLFAGTGNNGVYKSTDNGSTWAAANKGLELKWINSLAVSGSNIFAGSTYDGVFVTSNGGTTWTSRNNGLTDIHINTLFSAATGIYASTGGGVYYSNNNGATWTSANTGLPSTYDIYAWAQMGDTIYGGTLGTGMYMRISNSGSWLQVTGGLPTGLTGVYIYALGANGNNMYAGTNFGIYKSSDRGVTWSLSNQGMPSGAFVVTFAFKSGKIFAGTHSGGIFVSSDGGNTWSAANTGIKAWPSGMGPAYNYFRVNELEISGNNVVAATFDGMYKSADDGGTWTDANNGILGTRIMAVAAVGNTAFAGESNTGIYVTTNQGASWSRANNGLPNAAVLAMANRGNVVFASLENRQLVKTIDNGNTWTSAFNGLSNTVELMTADNNRILAITRGGFNYNQKLYESTDDGSTWTEIVGANAISGGMSAIALRGSYIYIGSNNGIVYRSGDNGASWLDIDNSGYMPTIKITAILSTDEATYVGTEGKGIYKFTNNDAVMTPASNGISNKNISDIRMEGGILFASTWGGGIFASGNGGEKWFGVNEGLNNLFVWKLASANAKVYAGTTAGVYQSEDDALSRIAILAGLEKNAMENGFGFYPNPSGGKVNFTLDGGNSGHIKVYSITGQLVYDQEVQAAGTLQLNGLPKGIYSLKTETERGTVTKKLILQ